jgi:hypothetical protein
VLTLDSPLAPGTGNERISAHFALGSEPHNATKSIREAGSQVNLITLAEKKMAQDARVVGINEDG